MAWLALRVTGALEGLTPAGAAGGALTEAAAGEGEEGTIEATPAAQPETTTRKGMASRRTKARGVYLWSSNGMKPRSLRSVWSTAS